MTERSRLLGATVSVLRNGAELSLDPTLSRSTETVAPTSEHLGERS